MTQECHKDAKDIHLPPSELAPSVPQALCKVSGLSYITGKKYGLYTLRTQSSGELGGYKA